MASPSNIIQIDYSSASGGIANNSKTGLQGSALFLKNLDIYSDGDSVSLNPAAVKDSGTVVVDLVKWIEIGAPFTTNRYAVGDAGNIYKIASNTWTLDRSGATVGNGAAGQGLAVYLDYAYYSTSTTIGRNGPLSGTPAYNDDYLTDGVTNLDWVPTVTVTGQTYTPPTSISESATALAYFTPTYDPTKTVSLWVTTKGTGNWTVTVHDANNVNLGSATIANASVTAGAYNAFSPATPIRVNIGQKYHFHVTSTVADGAVRTGVASDLTAADFKTIFGILIADTNYHPLIQHTNGANPTLLVGNGPYIGQIVSTSTNTTSTLVYNPNKVALEPGYNVRYFFKENEFVVAACWKGTTVDAYDQGKFFYWDGISAYYNFVKPITLGTPNASLNFKNRVLSVIGSVGNLVLGTEPFRKLQPMPQLGRGLKIEVTPGGITTWLGRAQIGVGINSSDSTGLVQGVYEFGNQSDRALSFQEVSTEVLNMGYTISTGDTKGTTMQIGCVQGLGQDMYIAWKSQAGTFGVDRVNKTNNPAATGSYESLINDIGMNGQQLVPCPLHTKMADRLAMTFVALPTGCTVTPKWKLDRAANWTYGAVASAGSSYLIQPITNRYREIQVGYDLVATVNYPLITGFFYFFDPLVNEAGDS